MYTVLFLYIQYKYYHMDIYPRYKVYSCRTYKKSPWSTFVHQNQPTLESLSLFLSEVKSCDLKHLSSLTIRCTAFKRGQEFIMATGKERPVFNILYSHDCVDVVRKLSQLVSKFSLKDAAYCNSTWSPLISHHLIYGLNSLAGSITLDFHYGI